MRILSFAYRALSDFAFLAVVYFSLNYMDKYQHRATLAILFLVYGVMRGVSVLRSFYFYQLIERFEVEARRLVTAITEGGARSPLRKQTVSDVSVLRRDNELKAYMDLFFLALVVLLCITKIVTD
jgi:DMSO reductase anchor subunit